MGVAIGFMRVKRGGRGEIFMVGRHLHRQRHSQIIFLYHGAGSSAKNQGL